MAAASWPINLPFLCNLDDETLDTRVKSQPEVGPAKVRNRTTAGVRKISGTVYFDGQQRLEWESFFNVTLQRGTLPFDHTDPIDESPCTYRVDSFSKFSMVAGGDPVLRKWTASITLEMLPDAS